jgi:2-polyprenyl-3-methyl-5-hydroxy-6-metoxy-1,4-benzoquinol methylase
MTHDIADLYRDKGASYFGTPRLDLLGMLPAGGGLSLLELGAGDGATLRAAKRLGLASSTAGIDLVAPDLGAADERIDRFLTGDCERMELDLPPGSFDAVLCADVLEHLVDPWRMVRRLTELLRPGGLFLASLPNFRNHRAWWPILFAGDFRYEPSGLRDHTHLRFFCRQNIEQLFQNAGLEVEAMAENMGAYGRRHRLLDALTCRLGHDFFVFQFRVQARKPAP